jgi:hypothetical protein
MMYCEDIINYSPAFHLCPHFKQVITTFLLPINPPNKPTGPSNTPPTAALPKPKPFFPAVI